MSQFFHLPPHLNTAYFPNGRVPVANPQYLVPTNPPVIPKYLPYNRPLRPTLPSVPRVYRQLPNNVNTYINRVNLSPNLHMAPAGQAPPPMQRLPAMQAPPPIQNQPPMQGHQPLIQNPPLMRTPPSMQSLHPMQGPPPIQTPPPMQDLPLIQAPPPANIPPALEVPPSVLQMATPSQPTAQLASPPRKEPQLSVDECTKLQEEFILKCLNPSSQPGLLKKRTRQKSPTPEYSRSSRDRNFDVERSNSRNRNYEVEKNKSKCRTVDVYSSNSRNRVSIRERSNSRNRVSIRERSNSRNRVSIRERSNSRNRVSIRERSNSRNRVSIRERSNSRNRISKRERSNSRNRISETEKDSLRGRNYEKYRGNSRNRSCEKEREDSKSRFYERGRNRSRSSPYDEREKESFRSRVYGTVKDDSRNRTAKADRESSRNSTQDRNRRSRSSSSDRHSLSNPKQSFIEKWRLNNCSTRMEMQDKLEEISHMKPEEIIKKEKLFWTRSAPADLYYIKKGENSAVLQASEKLILLCNQFEEELVKRGQRTRAAKPPYQCPPRKKKLHRHKCCNLNHNSSSDSSSENDSEEEGLLEELERKKAHPDRLHPELWFNDPGEMNDGPLCRCSAKAKRSGIRHNIYAGELSLEKCDINTNNSNRLFHYRITISPPTNFLIKTPTVIDYDHHEFIFEGYSMFSHKPLENLPVCKVIRFNIEYTILYVEEKLPQNFTIRELDLFHEYLFKEILELVDLDFRAAGDSGGCSQFHFMPRFVRELPENGKELLSMNIVLSYLLQSSKLLIPKEELADIINLPNYKWQKLVDEVKGMVVTYPGKKPCSIRVDQLDKDQSNAIEGNPKYPEIVHFGIRPPQLSYAGNPEYQKAWREYVKFRHLLANMPKSSYEDKRKLEAKENKLQEMRSQSKMKRDVTVAVSSEGFYRTGIMCDIVQHAMLLPVLVSHLRFHRSLDVLENKIKYKFKNRSLLQLALTHPSYRENFGTNPDHARNSLTNCGIRQPEYGDRRIHYMNTRKRGINTLINIMSRFGKKRETESNITHNERLEFLGDAVVEFVSSIHLFHLFPRLEEGGLATYRAAIVQNQHLAVLAKTLGLDGYMLYAHGSDLCHDLELRHAMANCFEALMGALFLDGGIEAADKVFGEVLFEDDEILLDVWQNYPPHPLQDEEPSGDRKWIESYQMLKNLTKFEDSIGVEFSHIRLLARAFTDRSMGYNNLTLGSNQRLEFLGDTVLQLIASEYLYKYFPEHHEGHLSLLRSSLVNNRTQAVVCDDLGMAAYAVYSNPKAELKTKDRADLLEAFLGALYVDKGLDYCQTFCNVCFFPRLHDFIMHQDWNDPKSKLQQCCLTLRTMEGGEPEIPVYKVIQCMGPTNTRLYTVAVYFKGKRLAQASGHSIQQAEMNAAKVALEHSQSLFPQLDHQKRVIAKSIKQDPMNPNLKKRDKKEKEGETRKRWDYQEDMDNDEDRWFRRRRTSYKSRRLSSSEDRSDSDSDYYRGRRKDRKHSSSRSRSSSSSRSLSGKSSDRRKARSRSWSSSYSSEESDKSYKKRVRYRSSSNSSSGSDENKSVDLESNKSFRNKSIKSESFESVIEEISNEMANENEKYSISDNEYDQFFKNFSTEETSKQSDVYTSNNEQNCSGVIIKKEFNSSDMEFSDEEIEDTSEKEKLKHSVKEELKTSEIEVEVEQHDHIAMTSKIL